MSAIEKKIAVIGIGNCGNQIGALFQKLHGDIGDVVYINSSEADLAMVPSSDMKFHIAAEFMEGSGKNRARTKKFLKEDISKIIGNTDFQQVINEKKYVFVVSSTAGGTGSGAAPVLMNILQEVFLDVNFILVAVLPSLQASLMEQGNAREYMDELYKNLDQCTYMVYDNDTANDLSPTQALVAINEAIVEDIRIISGVDNYPTPYESIDEADMENILTTPGRAIVVRVNKGITEKILEDESVDDIIIKGIKKSRHAEINRDKKIARCGIITYFTEECNRLYGAALEKLWDFIGTPIERFNHNAVNESNESMNFLYFVASGLSPINDRIKKMDERVDELKRGLERSHAGDYIESSEHPSYEVMKTRKAEKRQAKKNSDDGIDITSIFDKF